MAKGKVLVAMSGGVDSSVAAVLLLREGYYVEGVFMQLSSGEVNEKGGVSDAGSVNVEGTFGRAATDARKVAAHLGIKLHELDCRREMAGIINYFIDEYRRARTPNPCVMCNINLKFGKLMRYALDMGMSYLATGHYARIVTVAGEKRLARASNIAKDQSYALFGIGCANLGQVLLPLCDYEKVDVRKLAKESGLPVHAKAESQEICFVPDDDYAGFIRRRVPELSRPGDIVDTKGNILGQHDGVFNYTIGQRRGLGVALGKPAYVVSLDAESNTVVLGFRDDLMRRKLRASNVQWLVGSPPREPFRAIIQIRYNHRGAAGLVTPLAGDWVDGNGDDVGSSSINSSGVTMTNSCSDAIINSFGIKGNRVRVDFDEPVFAVTPGQAAVFYDDNNTVLGGGWIDGK